MADLIAQGPKPGDGWSRPLPDGQTVLLGRDADGWTASWEPYLSRRHAELVWRHGRLEVRRLPEARNPIFVAGREADRFELHPKQCFVIGTTSFTVADRTSGPGVTGPPVLEATVSAPELMRRQFGEGPHRLDVLSRLPDVISSAADEEQLFVGLVNMLLAGIPAADVAAVVRVLPRQASAEGHVEVLHWERRLAAGSPFEPSAGLVRSAVCDRKQTVLHVWAADGTSATGSEFTVVANCDWAFCTPVRSEAAPGWAIYVAGRFAVGNSATLRGPLETSELADDLKFTELVAAILASLRQVRALQRQQTSLSQFFSPAVLHSLAGADPEKVLAPREADLAILFCDLRGFSRVSEKAADLLSLLDRVSRALGVMTQNILDQKGVIGDFHGDAAMGFWGWPHPQPDAVKQACLAALGIRTFFEAMRLRKDHPLSGFQVGIGIASGRAVAGKIGTVNQVKVTVFGPVVNLASRLEGMTKILRAPILLDEASAAVLRDQGLWGLFRWRRVARVKPYGLEKPLVVTELLPPVMEFPPLNEAHLADYEQAVDSLIAGDWGRAYDLLRKMPPEDRVPDFLTALIVKHDRQAPPGWAGVVEMDSKT
jgi:adenylate cyclase